MKGKKHLINYLSFTRSERTGTLVLVVILVLIIVLPLIFRNIILPNKVYIDADYQQIDSFFNDLSIVERNWGQRKVKNKFSVEEREVEQPEPKAQLFRFDPNTISSDSLLLLGLSQKQVAVVCNYRNKGGKFRQPSDFAKIYSIDAEMHKRLLPLISIDTSAFVKTKFERKVFENNAPVIVSVNSADTLELRKVRGIGAVFARRIVAYRTLLGGFYSAEQLLEVYGMNKKMYEMILPNISIDTGLIKTININTTTYEILKEHPYITDYEAKTIIYYRSKVHSILNLNQLLDNKLLTSAKYHKLKPYLVVK